MSLEVYTRLKSERALLRRAFTNCCNKIDLLLAQPNFSYADLCCELDILEDKANRLFTLDDKVSEVIFTVVTDETDLEKEYDTIEGYREKRIFYQLKRDQLFKVDVPSMVKTSNKPLSKYSVSSSHVSEASKSNVSAVSKGSVSYSTNVKHVYKLPKLELRKFDGQIRNWLGFWAQHRKIFEDDALDGEEKFQFLYQSTTEGSPARELMDSFPPSAANYVKAVDLLKNRFGRDELLIELYVRELLMLVLAQSNGIKSSLQSLYDKLEAQLNALDSLGVTSDKYACMLFPLVESALPESTLIEWQRKRSTLSAEQSTKDASSIMSTLLKFLHNEVLGEERLAMARLKLVPDTLEGRKPKIKTTVISEHTRTPTSAGLVNLKVKSDRDLCIFCDGKHASDSCFRARTFDLEKRLELAKNKGCCTICLKRNHVKKNCKAFLKCIICDKKHVPLLCPEKKPIEGDTSNKVEANLCNKTYSHVLLQTLFVKLRGSKVINARALIDTASQRSYITQKLASEMEYVPLREEKLAHALFGGVTSEVKNHLCYKIRIGSMDNKYFCNFEALDSPEICNTVPVASKGPWIAELSDKNIVLSDFQEDPIGILIGADIAGKLLTGKIEVLSSGLVAVETFLGWTLMGKVKGFNGTYMCNVSLLCAHIPAEEMWRLDTLGIEDPVTTTSRQQKAESAREHFLSTVSTLHNGRYEVQLPWIQDHPPLPRHFEVAKQRLKSTLRKLNAANLVQEYQDVFLDWLKEGIIEEVAYSDWDSGHYLPHRYVLKEGSTTRIRPVFDASCQSRGFPSLNQCLEKGPNLIELIPRVLLRFRSHAVGIVADIKRAFLQLSVAPSDRDFLRFLWQDEDGQLKIFRHKRVVFGVSSSPFLLGAVIDHHLSKYDNLNFPECDYAFMSHLKKSFYVDNSVTSLPNVKDVPYFINNATRIFAEACFELRGWEFSDPMLEQSTSTPVLGLLWDRKEDTLSVNIAPFRSLVNESVTRRIILSATQRVFDPIGVTCATTLIPKMLVQQTWSKGGNWDSPVDNDIEIVFQQWIGEVSSLQDIKMDRCFHKYQNTDAKLSLHTFCDASQKAYAAVVFLRVELQDEVRLHLVEARSRVAPLKGATIPRLELLATTLGTRLSWNVLKELSVDQCFYWTDSTTALAWIQREEPWNIFVFNRVSEIRKLSNTNNWHHVPGVFNPADLLSRGCFPKILVASHWWEGPSWLLRKEFEWPVTKTLETIETDENSIMAERKKTVLAVVAQDPSALSSANLSRYFSSYHRIVRMVAWILRFLFNKFSRKPSLSGDLSSFELSRAERLVIRVIQDESFEGLKDKKLLKLKPHFDSSGLIRLRTRIWARKDAEDFRSPFILPSEHIIVNRMIMEVHKRTGHICGQGLLNVLRERFWIIRGRQTVRRVVSKCVHCRRVVAKALEVEAPPLPENRVRDARVFEVSGIDYAGPLYLNNGEKVWVCLFTCAIYRVTHLELVTALSTEVFMLAFRRFIARWGRPSIMYSDNGSNFRGLQNVLENVDWTKIVEKSSVDKIEWRFNPPTAAWWGGFWERLIGILKTLLKKILGRASLNFEELNTIICECTSFINSRPITYSSEDPNDPVPITPQMFICDIREMGVPDLNQVDDASLQRKIKRRLKIKELLKARFRSEYLGQMAMAATKIRNDRVPSVGEIVLIGSDNQKRLDWPMGIIEELLPGQDNKYRVAKLRTSNGMLTRPVQRLYPLEVKLWENQVASADVSRNYTHGNPPKAEVKYPDVTSESPSEEEEMEEAVLGHQYETRCGRKVQLPARFCD